MKFLNGSRGMSDSGASRRERLFLLFDMLPFRVVHLSSGLDETHVHSMARLKRKR